MRRMGIGLGVGINRSNYAQGIFSAYQSRVIADGGVTEGGACVDAVSSLLQSASLLLIPSGYKGGKAYAEIPTNGNGDLTWTRASTALRTNSSGLLESMGSGVPRLSYMYGSCPALLLEPQRTNVVTYSSDLSQSVWSKTNYTLSSATAIQGLTATRITKNSTNNGGYNGTGARDVINTVGTFTSGIKAFSVLLRKGNTAKVGLLINNILVGALTNVGCEFDFSTETFTNVASGLTASFEKPTTDVYRIILVCNDIGIGTNKQLWIAPIDSSNNTVTDGYIDIAYFQWELGAYPTTYIPTTTASATRIADSASKTGISSLIGQTEGTLFLDFIFKTSDSSVGGQIGVSDSAKSNRVILWNNVTFNTLALQIKANNVNTINNVSLGTFVDGTRYKIAIAYKSGDTAVYVNGTQTITNSSTFTFSSSLADFILGSYETTLAVGHQFCFKSAVFTTRLINSELVSLTS